MERIDKVLSGLGVLTRSECKKAIKTGRIRVNGELCKSPDMKIDPDSVDIELDGSHIDSREMVYYILNKPQGYITATNDDVHQTVFDLINDTRRDLAAVGRLDKDTTGILLITNDGQLNHKMLSAKYHVAKRYIATIEGKLSQDSIKLLEEGVDIGDEQKTLPAKVEFIKVDEPQVVALTIIEGRYHQVKRMFESVGCKVIQLHRTDFGPLQLDDTLLPGEYRELNPDEIKKCYSHVR